MKTFTAIKVALLILAIVLVGFVLLERAGVTDSSDAVTAGNAQTIPQLDPSVIADLENQISREIAIKESNESPAEDEVDERSEEDMAADDEEEASTTEEANSDASEQEADAPGQNQEVPGPVDTVPSYITVTDSCGPDYGGDCLRVRSEPSTSGSIQSRVRNGQTLKVGDYVEGDGRWWYEIEFDEWLRYPDRLEGEWYVAAEFVRPVPKESLVEPAANREKRIVVNLTEQMLYAYEDDELFMEEPVSTGKLGAATPRGTFAVFYRTPSRYMQGPLPGITDDDYDLPGVPWNLYFTQQGAVIHGAYWHDNFGQHWSHGCVNLPPEQAEKLYAWTTEGTTVTVRD